jgi:hypothetical protein
MVGWFGLSLSLSQRSINSAAIPPTLCSTRAVKLNRQINVYAKSHLRQTQLHWFAALVAALASLFRSIQLLPSKHVFRWMPADVSNPDRVITAKPDISQIISLVDALCG